MRAAKILAGLVGGIFLLIVVGLLAVWFLVNPNDYKPKIEASVQESSGRKLLLPGAIKLSVFPWIALELGPASLGNPPGFDGEPFLAFNRAAVRIRLIPLLHGQLEIGRVEIDGLDVRARRNAAGKGNWEVDEDEKGTPDEPSQGGYHAAFKSFAGLHITNARISYQDQVIEKLEIETGSFTDRARIPISISFDADMGPDEKATVSAKFTLSLDESTEDMQFAAVSLSGLASRPGSNRETHWEVTAPTIDVGFKKQTLAVPSFAVTYLGAHVTGKLSATKFMDDPTATGSVKLDALSLREFIPRLGIAVPRVHDARALSQVAASGDFEYDGKGARLPKVEVVLDDTHLHGAIALVNGETKDAPKALKFDLGVDAIDLNRYLVDSNGEPAPKPTPATAAEKPEKPMEADGTLSIASVRFSSLDFTSVRATLASHEGVVHIAPVQALIDGGRYSGDITLDDRGAVPVISMDEHLTGVDIAKLMAQGAAKGRVSGHGNVNLKATAHGASGDAVFKSLNGTFDANLAQGALEGIDLAYALAQAESLIEHQTVAAVQNAGRTQFDAFKMSAQITNGVAATKDINISSPVLKVTGQGRVNLPTKALDLGMLATVLKAPGKTAAEVPMRITGTYLDPTVRPDLEGMARSAVKDKLQNVLQDKLKGLFGKP